MRQVVKFLVLLGCTLSFCFSMIPNVSADPGDVVIIEAKSIRVPTDILNIPDKFDSTDPVTKNETE